MTSIWQSRLEKTRNWCVCGGGGVHCVCLPATSAYYPILMFRCALQLLEALEASQKNSRLVS